MSEKREAVLRAIAEWASAEEFTGALIFDVDKAIDDEIADERRKAVAELPCYQPHTVSMTCSEWNQRSDEQLGLCPTCKVREEGQIAAGRGYWV